MRGLCVCSSRLAAAAAIWRLDCSGTLVKYHAGSARVTRRRAAEARHGFSERAFAARPQSSRRSVRTRPRTSRRRTSPCDLHGNARTPAHLDRTFLGSSPEARASPATRATVAPAGRGLTPRRASRAHFATRRSRWHAPRLRQARVTILAQEKNGHRGGVGAGCRQLASVGPHAWLRCVLVLPRRLLRFHCAEPRAPDA